MCEGFTLEYVDVGEVTLRVRHGGDGQPVVLLHGHPRTHTRWHRVAPPLAGSFFVTQGGDSVKSAGCGSRSATGAENGSRRPPGRRHRHCVKRK